MSQDQAPIRTGYPSAATAWWLVAILSFAGLVSYTDRLILSVLVDPLRQELMISDSQVSLLQGAAFALIYVFAGLPLGRLADRSQRRRILIFGASIWCVGGVICGLAPGYWPLLMGRLLVGVGEAALAPAAVSMIADSFAPSRRGTAVGVFLMGMVLGGPAAIAIGGVVLQAAQAGAFEHWPFLSSLSAWRQVLVLVGVGGFAAPLLFLTLREPIRQEVTRGDASLKSVIGGLFADRSRLAPLYIAMALLSVGDYGLLSWLPSLLTRKFLLPPAELGLLFGVITAITGITGVMAGGVLADVAGRRGGMRLRMGLMAVSAALAAVGALLVCGPTAIYALVGLGLWTFGSAVASTGGIAALQELVPNEYRGVGMSLVAFCNTLLGLGAGPTLVAVLTEQGFKNPTAIGFAMTGVVLPAGAIACGLFLLARASTAKRGISWARYAG